MSPSPDIELENRHSRAEETVPFLELDARNGGEEQLPPPASAPPSKQTQSKLSVSIIVPIWIALSSTVILYNNYLYNTLDFKYPVSALLARSSKVEAEYGPIGLPCNLAPHVRSMCARSRTLNSGAERFIGHRDASTCPYDQASRRNERSEHDAGLTATLHSAYRFALLGVFDPIQ